MWLRSCTSSKVHSSGNNLGIFKVGLDIGFPAVNCFLLLVALLVVVGTLCILILNIRSAYALFSSTEQLSRWPQDLPRPMAARVATSLGTGKVPQRMQQPFPALSCYFASFCKVAIHKWLFQNTEAALIAQNFTASFFLSFLLFSLISWEAGSKWYTGQLGYWEYTQHPICYAWQVSFMLWDTSAISDLSAAPPVVPLLPVYHAGCQGCPISLSFDMGWEWQAGERGRPQPLAERQAGGWGSEYSCWKLSGSCQVIP